MKEVKTPKKPLAIYYAIVLLVLMLLNFVLVPWMSDCLLYTSDAADE